MRKWHQKTSLLKTHMAVKPCVLGHPRHPLLVRSISSLLSWRSLLTPGRYLEISLLGVRIVRTSESTLRSAIDHSLTNFASYQGQKKSSSFVLLYVGDQSVQDCQIHTCLLPSQIRAFSTILPCLHGCGPSYHYCQHIRNTAFVIPLCPLPALADTIRQCA